MGIIDKAKNAAEDVIGKAKEVVGDVAGNDELEAEGQKDQGVSGVKRSARHQGQVHQLTDRSATRRAASYPIEGSARPALRR